jgi:hypothetical protein
VCSIPYPAGKAFSPIRSRKWRDANANYITQSDFIFIHNYMSLSSLESNMTMIAAGSSALGFGSKNLRHRHRRHPCLLLPQKYPNTSCAASYFAAASHNPSLRRRKKT